MSNTSGVLALMDEARSVVPATVRRLKEYYGDSVNELAELVGLERRTLSARLHEDIGFRQEEVYGLAFAFGVPMQVLYLNPDDALRFVMDHKAEINERLRDLGLRPCRCTWSSAV